MSEHGRGDVEVAVVRLGIAKNGSTYFFLNLGRK